MDAKHYADQLAVCAVTGDKRGLVKVAAGFDFSQLGGQISGGLQNAWNTPALRNAMIGIGAGGLIGLMQPKRKFRNALQYGLLGGLGGLGYSALSGDLNKLFEQKKEGPAAAPGAGAGAGGNEQKPPVANSGIPGLPTNRPLTQQEQIAVESQKGGPSAAVIGGGAMGAVGGGVAGNQAARYLENRMGGGVGALADKAQGPLGEGLRQLREYAPIERSMGDLSPAARPGAVAKSREFVANATKSPPGNNPFLNAGIRNTEEAQRAINNAANLINNERLPLNPFRTRQVLEDTARVINSNNPGANITAGEIQRAIQGATPRMGWLRALGTGGGSLAGAVLGGSAGANYDAIQRAQIAARLREAQSGMR